MPHFLESPPMRYNPQQIVDRLAYLELALATCMAQRDELLDLNIELNAYVADLRDEVAALEGEIDDFVVIEWKTARPQPDAPPQPPERPMSFFERARLTRIARELFDTWIGRILSADGARAVDRVAEALRAELDRTEVRP